MAFIKKVAYISTCDMCKITKESDTISSCLFFTVEIRDPDGGLPMYKAHLCGDCYKMVVNFIDTAIPYGK